MIQIPTRSTLFPFTTLFRFFFNDTATNEIYTLSLHDALPISVIIIALIQYRNNKHKQKANVLLQQQKEKVETTLSELKITQSQLIQSEKMVSTFSFCC